MIKNTLQRTKGTKGSYIQCQFKNSEEHSKSKENPDAIYNIFKRIDRNPELTLSCHIIYQPSSKRTCCPDCLGDAILAYLCEWRCFLSLFNLRVLRLRCFLQCKDGLRKCKIII